MPRFFQKTPLILTALFLAACTGAVNDSGKDSNTVQPVKHLSFHAMPYYAAYQGKVEHIDVHPQLDLLLASSKVADYRTATHIVEQQPDAISPMTMFVLAARAYDVGQRDEAVQWYYRGQNRLITALHVLDLPKIQVAQFTGFAQVLGRFINGYAFCDFTKQRQAAEEAVQWTKSHPYQALFLPKLPSHYPDRRHALKEAEAQLDKRLTELDQYFSDPKNKAEFLQNRQKHQTEERFCRF